MQLAGQEPSVLAGETDNSSGGEVVRDLLVGLLLCSRGDFREAIDGGDESDAGILGRSRAP